MQHGAGRCDAESGLVSQCGSVHIHLPRNQSIHCARSGASRSSAALRCHHETLFNKHMGTKGDLFVKNHPAQILHWAPRESLSLGIRNAPAEYPFYLFSVTQLTLQFRQERSQVVCSNMEARKRPAQGHSRNGP